MSAAAAFTWPVRVYFEDTDAGGIVYHANYLRYCERARTEWLRALGFDQQQLRTDPGIVFTVRRALVDFRLPAQLDDALVVTTTLAQLRGARIGMHQEILRGEDLLVGADIEVACVDSRSLRPRRLPAPIVSRFEHAT